MAPRHMHTSLASLVPRLLLALMLFGGLAARSNACSLDLEYGVLKKCTQVMCRVATQLQGLRNPCRNLSSNIEKNKGAVSYYFGATARIYENATKASAAANASGTAELVEELAAAHARARAALVESRKALFNILHTSNYFHTKSKSLDESFGVAAGISKAQYTSAKGANCTAEENPLGKRGSREDCLEARIAALSCGDGSEDTTTESLNQASLALNDYLLSQGAGATREQQALAALVGDAAGIFTELHVVSDDADEARVNASIANSMAEEVRELVNEHVPVQEDNGEGPQDEPTAGGSTVTNNMLLLPFLLFACIQGH
uniref:Uncharacterized protein TCIL3000_7_3440 n=1 Tax=Trypanosoma congolense (strain IL3000) TaxID=1068625 RepID=G0UQ69_TRYCI|nr:unnamed protein product [Trypanosoma congolense IL3000]